MTSTAFRQLVLVGNISRVLFGTQIVLVAAVIIIASQII